MTDDEAINACPMCDEEGLLWRDGEPFGRCSHQLIDALLLNGVMCASCARVLTRAEVETSLDPASDRDPHRPADVLPLLLCADCGGRLAAAESFDQWLDEEWERRHR